MRRTIFHDDDRLLADALLVILNLCMQESWHPAWDGTSELPAGNLPSLAWSMSAPSESRLENLCGSRSIGGLRQRCQVAGNW